jgi:hypothetical protein
MVTQASLDILYSILDGLAQQEYGEGYCFEYEPSYIIADSRICANNNEPVALSAG